MRLLGHVIIGCLAFMVHIPVLGEARLALTVMRKVRLIMKMIVLRCGIQFWNLAHFLQPVFTASLALLWPGVLNWLSNLRRASLVDWLTMVLLCISVSMLAVPGLWAILFAIRFMDLMMMVFSDLQDLRLRIADSVCSRILLNFDFENPSVT